MRLSVFVRFLLFYSMLSTVRVGKIFRKSFSAVPATYKQIFASPAGIFRRFFGGNLWASCALGRRKWHVEYLSVFRFLYLQENKYKCGRTTKITITAPIPATTTTARIKIHAVSLSVGGVFLAPPLCCCCWCYCCCCGIFAFFFFPPLQSKKNF